MTAKEVRFSVDARDRMLRGIDILAHAVRVTLGPKPRQFCIGSLNRAAPLFGSELVANADNAGKNQEAHSLSLH